MRKPGSHPGPAGSRRRLEQRQRRSRVATRTVRSRSAQTGAQQQHPNTVRRNGITALSRASGCISTKRLNPITYSYDCSADGAQRRGLLHLWAVLAARPRRRMTPASPAALDRLERGTGTATSERDADRGRDSRKACSRPEWQPCSHASRRSSRDSVRSSSHTDRPEKPIEEKRRSGGGGADGRRCCRPRRSDSTRS